MLFLDFSLLSMLALAFSRLSVLSLPCPVLVLAFPL
uniref:Uncharacterized protein n=1 Tax=Rhizophora mucronata TaxID=61149 RepID=A0A2P2PEV0_RHIMU